MTLSIHRLSVPVFTRMLGNLALFVERGCAAVEASGMAPAALMEARLAPDMFGLARQVQIAADGARGAAARLAGQAPPSPEAPRFAVFNRGDERGFDPMPADAVALAAYAREAARDLEALSPDLFAGAEGRRIVVTMHGRSRHFEALPFLIDYALPNFYFHVAMAYAILRHLGVPLGKPDYEGPPVYAGGDGEA
ncbi:MAG TPA: DUF1993 domain-containing protein [Alphaproteobacteria bacterium]|nr:DUF1993 domain-containing protein [Alphaproteobacteria bacterium]